MLSELPLKDCCNNKPTFLGDTMNTVMFIHSMFLPNCHNYNLESKPAIAAFAYQFGLQTAWQGWSPTNSKIFKSLRFYSSGKLKKKKNEEEFTAAKILSIFTNAM